MLFSTTFRAPTASIFLLLVQKKGTKEKDTRILVGISNPNSLRFLSKTGAAQLAQCYAFNALKQCSLIPVLLKNARLRLTRFIHLDGICENHSEGELSADTVEKLFFCLK